MSIYGQNHIPNGIDFRRGDFNITRENGSYRNVNIPFFIDINKNVDELQACALALDHPELPKEGDKPIPGVPLFVNSLNASIYDRSSEKGYIVKVDVSCVGYGDYSGPGIFTYYFRGSNRNIETGYDYFGRKIEMTYSPTTGPDVGKTFKQYPKIDRETMDWFVYAKGVVFSNEPSMDIGKRWAMRVNEDNFLGFLPGELLCTNIEMDPVDIYNKPNKWRVQFTFHSRYEKWLPLASYINAKTGEIPSDITFPNGIKPIQIYGYRPYKDTWPLNGVLETPPPPDDDPKSWDLNMHAIQGDPYIGLL